MSTDRQRYRRQPITRQPDMIIGGQNLGPALKPQDILIWLKVAFVLEDDDILDAFGSVLEREDLASSFPDLRSDEVDAMRSAAAEVTRSRILAWRKRNREMTWLEMRALLIGLRDIKL